MQTLSLRLFVLLAAAGATVLRGQVANPTYRFHTNLGDIDVVLTPSVAPLTVANFLNYVNSGAYNNTIFHRSVANFVIQAGGYQLVNGAPAATPATPSVVNEFSGVTNGIGTIAMAQTANAPNSATNQWFFNTATNGPTLDTTSNGPFVVFGHVLNAAGLTIMNRIAALPINDYSAYFGSDFSTMPTFGSSATPFALVTSIVPVPSVTSAGFESAASFASSNLTGISPGEIVVIYGQQIGPSQLTSATPVNGVIPGTLAGTQVLFNNKPAPVLYTSAAQVAVIVPYGISGLPSVNVIVSYQGTQATALTFTVRPANPAIFTLNSMGTGDAAIQRFHGATADVISTANPASVGDVLTLYGEGYGAATDNTSLPDGAIVAAAQPVILPVPADSTTVLMIDGKPVPTQYFGGAPGLVNGALQVNFTVPALNPGSHSVQLQVGSRTSPTGVNLQTK